MSSAIRARQTELMDMIRPVFKDVPEEMLYPTDSFTQRYMELWRINRPQVEQYMQSTFAEGEHGFVWNPKINGLLDSIAEDYLQIFYWEKLADKLEENSLNKAWKIYETSAKEHEQKHGNDPDYKPLQAHRNSAHIQASEKAEIIRGVQRGVIEGVKARVAQTYLYKLQESDYGLSEAEAAKLVGSAIYGVLKTHSSLSDQNVNVSPMVGGSSPGRIVSSVNEHARASEDSARYYFSTLSRGT